MFGNRGQKARASTTTLSNTMLETNVSRASLPKFAKGMAALDRHLKHNGSKISIAKDRDFVKCRQVLEGKARVLREKSPRKRPNSTKALTVQDEEQVWKNRVLGEQNRKSLGVPVHFFLLSPFSATVKRLQLAKQWSTTFIAVR